MDNGGNYEVCTFRNATLLNDSAVQEGARLTGIYECQLNDATWILGEK